jgi:hypothetical protein
MERPAYQVGRLPRFGLEGPSLDGETLAVRVEAVIAERLGRLPDRLDPVRRVHLHQAVGPALERLFGERAQQTEAVVPQLARHFQEAGIAQKAVAYLLVEYSLLCSNPPSNASLRR